MFTPSHVVGAQFTPGHYEIGMSPSIRGTPIHLGSHTPTRQTPIYNPNYNLNSSFTPIPGGFSSYRMGERYSYHGISNSPGMDSRMMSESPNYSPNSSYGSSPNYSPSGDSSRIQDDDYVKGNEEDEDH